MPIFHTISGRKFFRLDAIINFIEIDSIRRPSFSIEEIAQFFDSSDLETALIDLTQRQYHAEVDESLEDDIYKQNSKRTRSITELVSNAIDAGALKVDVVINQGYYQVTE